MSTAASKQIMMVPGLDTKTVKALPVFLVKLLNMLEDESLDDIICWDESGSSFHILDSPAFCDEVLPKFFKHKNLNSFVRQLNFYGFRKLASVDKTSLCYMENPGNDLHFMHPKFVRYCHDLMFEIKRQTHPTKKLTSAIAEKQEFQACDEETKFVTVAQADLMNMMRELTALRQKQEELENTVESLSRGHDLLWDEMRILRETNAKQSDCFNKLIQFLISVMPANRRVARRQRPFVESDKMIIPSGHGGDVLSCIQQQLHESLVISKRSVLEDELTIPKNEVNYEFAYDTPINQVVPSGMIQSNDMIVPVKRPHEKQIQIVQRTPTTYVQCNPSTSYINEEQDTTQDQQTYPLVPMMPDEGLLEEIDKNNMLEQDDLMEYLANESSGLDNAGFGDFLNETDGANWHHALEELSPK